MSSTQLACTIFIVDDDEAVRDSLRWLLEANGYRVKCFSSAEEFLQHYDPEHIGVLIVDVRMPGCNAFTKWILPEIFRKYMADMLHDSEKEMLALVQTFL